MKLPEPQDLTRDECVAIIQWNEHGNEDIEPEHTVEDCRATVAVYRKDCDGADWRYVLARSGALAMYCKRVEGTE